MPLWRMRDHRSGSRYVCLNSTNVFLVGHLCTCICFAIYSFLWVALSYITVKALIPLLQASL